MMFLTYQGYFHYFDEQAMTDPMVVDAGLDGSAKTMVNKFVAKAIEEFEKATLEAAALGVLRLLLMLSQR